jgi:cytochrome c oxidase accessory protein FixG
MYQNRQEEQVDLRTVDSLYEDSGHWHVNTGGEKIHAMRIPGRFRRLKWMTHSLWLIFFLGPYLRWDDRQAVLFDIPARQFHLFGVTIMPQDVWMLALVLLFFAILLFVVTSIAGRVFCGYFCFQTVWTDVYTWIEARLEGNPVKRRKLDEAPWDAYKLRVKITKHALWLLIAMLTGVSFAAWFTDAFGLWHDYFTLQASGAAWVVLALFTAGTYILAGFMREQVCFWLCPYARIQGVMYDRDTILPAYDFKRGEPRGKLKKKATAEAGAAGDCVDCNLCVAVCPTGIDIREGQQEGCITCALCIDACDSIMDKIQRPRGLIRYASLDEIEGRPAKAWYRRPRVLVYFGIMTLAVVGIIYGLGTLAPLELKVLHERQPLFVLQSDGSVQNKYIVKILNKTERNMDVVLQVEGPAGLLAIGAEGPLRVQAHRVIDHAVFLRIPAAHLLQETYPVIFRVADAADAATAVVYNSVFIGPGP